MFPFFVFPFILCRRMADSASLQFVNSFAFEAMQKVDVARLAALSDPELRLLLPCLVRMALCAPADQSNAWAQDKKLILPTAVRGGGGKLHCCAAVCGLSMLWSRDG